MKSIKNFFVLAAVALPIIAACNKGAEPTPTPKPDPTPDPVVDPSPAPMPIRPLNTYEGYTLYGSVSSYPTKQRRWIDFQTGASWSSIGEDPAKNHSGDIDAGLFASGNDLYLTSPSGGNISTSDDSPESWTTKLKTRFYTIGSKDMDATKFAAIKTRDELLGLTIDGSPITTILAASTSPFQSAKLVAGMYIGFKTYSAVELNNYGIIEVKGLSDGKLTFNCKIANNGASEYSGAKVVKIENNKMLVDGKEFYANGAAATVFHERLADFGANSCRIYGAGLSSGTLLDQLADKGTMVYFGISMPQFRSSAASYSDSAWKENKKKEVIKIVETFKDHPAILCWNLGNELEVGGYGSESKIWSFIGELCDEVKKVDSNHPVTVTLASISQATSNSIKSNCPSLDFLSVNCYLPSAKNIGNYIKTCGWTKPYMITEYGPTGTWARTSITERINPWGALIQLSSEEAAANYKECYDTIKGFSGCLGSYVFWWGYQTHGEVLGWYPLITKDGYFLTGAEVMSNCWKGSTAELTGPKIESWKTSMSLNGKNLSQDRDPVLTPEQACTASVTAVSRNGHSLKYKWFLYKDNTYDISQGVTSASVTVAHHNLSDGSMDEDAGANLFTDRTLATVSFTAPTEKANYRLHVIAYDDITKQAAAACINFQVK